jgi:hypothetical protein
VPIELTLPKGGFDISFVRGVSEENTKVDTVGSKLEVRLPISPGPLGATKLEFSYLYPYESRTVEFDFPASVSRDKLTLLLAEKDYRLRSAKLTRQPPQTIQGKTFYLYSAGPLGPNETTFFAVSGLSRPGDIAAGLLYTGLGAVIAAALFFAFRRPKISSPLTKAGPMRERAFSKLADLEQRFQQGVIPVAEYRTERERWLGFLFDLDQKKRSSQAA